jgi:pSer/pThr/pTyr-binding forkhead associated (FHA) protein
VAEKDADGCRRLRYGGMWILQSFAPADESWTFRLPPGAIKTVGRAPRADFIVDAALVSRLHCRLTATERDVEVVDLASTNGTYVNDQRIAKASLAEGDCLRVGRVELRVERSVMTDGAEGQ